MIWALPPLITSVISLKTIPVSLHLRLEIVDFTQNPSFYCHFHIAIVKLSR